MRTACLKGQAKAKLLEREDYSMKEGATAHSQAHRCCRCKTTKLRLGLDGAALHEEGHLCERGGGVSVHTWDVASGHTLLVLKRCCNCCASTDGSLVR